MRIAITLVLILMAAGAAGAFALGRLIASEELRAQIVEQAEAMSGRTVRIDGRMNVGLLPRPTLSVGATRFLGADPSRQPLVDVDRIDLALAPLALLRGEVEIEGVRLVRPRFRLTDPDQPPVGLLQLLGAQAGVELPAGLERLSVIDGEVVIGAVAESALIVQRVDLELDAESESGPFFVDGTFVRAGEPFVLKGRLGRLTADPSTTASLELTTAADADEELALSFQGIVALDTWSSFRGQASVAGSRLDAALELLGPPSMVDPALPLAVPFAVEGAIDVDGADGEITALGVRLGAVKAEGRIGFALAPTRRLDLVLEIPRLDTAELGFDPHLLQAVAGLESIPHGEIDLSVATLVHESAAVRDVRLTLELEPGREILVRSSRAVLPGETDVLLEGRIRPGAEPAFHGKVSAVTDRLGEVLAWLEPAVPVELADRFRTLIVEAEVAAVPGRLELRALDGRLDASKVHGALALVLDETPEVRAALELDRLDLDRYLAGADLELVGGALLERLRSGEIALDLGVDRLTAGGLRWTGLAVDARAHAGRLELERLRVGLLADTSLELDGVIDLASERADLAVAVHSAKPGPLIRRLGPAPAFSLERLGELQIEGTLRGWTDAAEVAAEATLGRFGSSARGSAALDPAGEIVLDLDVELAHPSYPELLTEIGQAAFDMAVEPLTGAFKVRRQADGRTGMVGHIGLGPSRVTGQLDYRSGDDRTWIDGRLSIAEPKLDALLPLLALAGYRLDALSFAGPIPGAWPAVYLDAAPLRTLDGRLELSGKDASGEVAFDALLTSDAGLLRLERGRLELGEERGALSAEASLDVRASTPAVTIGLEGGGLALTHPAADDGDAPALAGRLDLYGKLAGTGWTAQDLVRSSRGELTLSVRDGQVVLPGVDEPAAGDTGAASLELLEARLEIERGLGRVARLEVETGQGTFTGGGLFDLLIWMIDLELEEEGGARRIGIVGPPGDLQVLVRTPEAPAPAE